MELVELRPGIYWVGAVDWGLREFHGYRTPRGTSYNAYLIMDEKVVLVDTVKRPFAGEMLDRIAAVVDPRDIDIVVANHVEMDHSGALSEVLRRAPRAHVVASPQGAKGLARHFKEGWSVEAVPSGGSLPIGKRTLRFVHTPMVHWPDSMATYVPEDRLLLPNDAFGQHIASAERFDDELGWDVLREEAAKYYANIVLPFGDNVAKALDAVGGLDVGMVAPSHGVVWRSRVPDIVGAYRGWSSHRTEERAVIAFDSMWGSTRALAQALREGLAEAGVLTTVRDLTTSHISDIMTDVLSSRLVCIGSPTLNNGVLPTVGALLTYLRGLRPKGRLGFAFGSYGWSGEAAGEVERAMDALGWERPVEAVRVAYVPDAGELARVKEAGRTLGGRVRAGAPPAGAGLERGERHKKGDGPGRRGG